MRMLKLLGLTLYAGYLVHIGLLLIILPWSQSWSWILMHLPPRAAYLLDAPMMRGALSGFGVLHLVLLGWELGIAGHTDEHP